MKTKFALYPIVLLAVILFSGCNMPNSQAAATPPPLQAADTQTPTILLMPTDPPTATPGVIVTPPPRATSDGKLTCAPVSKSTDRCVDEVLQVVFEYPAAWGAITAHLRKSAMTGYAYDYTLNGKSISDSAPFMAGGRSKDFTEGRGGMPTDFAGYGQGGLQVPAGCDSDWHKSFALCKAVGPNVAWMIDLPSAASLCANAGGPGFSLTPIFRIEINLPKNPSINGFVFQAPFISAQFADRLKSVLYPLIGVG
ncbi:MAG: hypothetical protein WA821_09280, partial [Anaerolineales bacterium]